MFSRYWALNVLGHEFDLSWSHDVIGHVTIRFPIGHFLLVVIWMQALTVSEIFIIANVNVTYAMVDMTLNDH